MHITTASLPYDHDKFKAEIISANTVLTRNVVIDFVTQLRMLFGGRITAYANLVADARLEVLSELEEQAAEKGAELAVALNIETNTILEGTIEVLAYATALIPKK
jgi:uncharacterized protein YbjQ (UPF0145 family)